MRFTWMLLVMLLIGATSAQAGPWKQMFQNIRLPSQVMLEHYTWTGPAVAGATSLFTSAGVGNGVISNFTVLNNSGNADFPRNVVLTTGGTTTSIAAGTAVVTGKNIFGKTISENFTISGNQNGATTGAKAFKSVSSIQFPAGDGAGATVTATWGAKLGLPHCLDKAGDYGWSIFDSAYESTRGTMAVNATGVESNTFTPNGTPDGSKVIEAIYFQNFRCFGN